jgi:hypothetical protein
MIKQFSILYTVPFIQFVDEIYENIQNIKIVGFYFVNFITKIENKHVIFILKFTNKKPLYRCEKNCPVWDEINCDQIDKKIKSPCRSAENNVYANPIRKHKVFIKGCENFFDYIKNIQSGKISKEFNRKMWDVILCNWRSVNRNIGKAYLINHNTDVNILHFKFVLIENRQLH